MVTPQSFRRLSVLIADDHAMVGEGLGLALGRYCTVVGRVQRLKDLKEVLRRTKPDVLLLDLMFQGECSLPAMEAAKKELGYSIPFIIVTAHDSPAWRRQACRTGASAFLLKDVSIQTLRLAIEAAYRGVRDSLVRGYGIEAPPNPTPPQKRIEIAGVRLRLRQVRVLLALAAGTDRRAIAETEGLTVKGIDYNVDTAKRYIGARTLVELVRWVDEHEDALRQLLDAGYHEGTRDG